MKSWIAGQHGRRVAIVSGVRTPFVKAGMDFKDCSAVHLGVTAVREAVARTEIKPDVFDELVLGNTGTPVDAANISRVVALRAGFPESMPAFTVHRNCAAAMEAISQACYKIGMGMGEVMVAGGTESMSNMPLLYGDEMKEFFSKLMMAKNPQDKLKAAISFRPQWLKPVISIMEGLTDPISGYNMGQTAEVLALDFGISRGSQDEFALRSHLKTAEARKTGRFDEEIVPTVVQPGYGKCISADIGPRDNQTIEALSKLKPFFDRDNGTITPGNACPITDGACALVLMSEERAKSEGREILGTVAAFTYAGCDPKRMGLGPVFATSKLLDDTGMTFKDIELVELNEAFAAQVIANQKAFSSKKFCQEKLGRSDAMGELRDEILNVNGGGIALGHPVGVTGARIVLTCLLEMKRRSLHRGLATLCIGGGQGAAFLLERN